jgi:hypothetical protein
MTFSLPRSFNKSSYNKSNYSESSYNKFFVKQKHVNGTVYYCVMDEHDIRQIGQYGNWKEAERAAREATIDYYINKLDKRKVPEILGQDDLHMTKEEMDDFLKEPKPIDPYTIDSLEF